MLGFGFDKVKSFRDRNFLEATYLSGLWASKKLKLNWLVKGMGSDSLTIRDDRIQQTHERVS